MSRFQFVDDHRARWSVKRLCDTLAVSRQGYYQWKQREPVREARAAADAATTARIHAIHAAEDGTYGAPRITMELREQGLVINRKRTARLMREAGICGLRLRKKHRTTIGAADPAGVPDLLERDFTATEANQRYVGDITYLPIADGSFLYLATVIDCYSRRLVGWSIADHMRTDLITAALDRAAIVRGGLHGAVFHSDHGAQYVSAAFAERCRALGVTRSRGRVGSSADNALAEAFNATLKRETLQRRRHWATTTAAHAEAESFIRRYNTRRRHSRLGHQSPINYETQQANLTLAA